MSRQDDQPGTDGAHEVRDQTQESTILAIDTDVLVHWAMDDAPHHRAIRQLFETEVEQGGRLGLTLQVLNEFVHVVTDQRRFDRPLSVGKALDMSRELWHGRETEQILPTAGVYDRMYELMNRHSLGRRRILDTALAATLEGAGVTRLATLNARDFAIFSFLHIVDLTVPRAKLR